MSNRYEPRKHDIVIVWKNPDKTIHQVIAAGLADDEVHVCYVVSYRWVAEMHISGLRTNEISDYLQYAVFRPNPAMTPVLEKSLDYNWRKHRWKRYGWLLGFSQAFYRWTGLQIPKVPGTMNCSMWVAGIVRYASYLMKAPRSILTKRPYRYDPARLFDALMMTPKYKFMGICTNGMIEPEKEAL